MTWNPGVNNISFKRDKSLNAEGRRGGSLVGRTSRGEPQKNLNRGVGEGGRDSLKCIGKLI